MNSVPRMIENFIDAVIEMHPVLRVVCVSGSLLTVGCLGGLIGYIFVVTISNYPQILLLLVLAVMSFSIYTFITAKED